MRQTIGSWTTTPPHELHETPQILVVDLRRRVDWGNVRLDEFEAGGGEVGRLNLSCRVDGKRIEFSWDGAPEVPSIAVPFLSASAEGVVAQGRYYIADSLSDDGFDVYEFDGLLERATKGPPVRHVRFLIGFPDGSSRVIYPVPQGWLAHRPNVAHFTYEEGGEPISIDLEMVGLKATFTCNEKIEAPGFTKYLKVEIVSK